MINKLASKTREVLKNIGVFAALASLWKYRVSQASRAQPWLHGKQSGRGMSG
jgi:hypothetical protein